jgi:sugar phosphate isomerase/epimerase
MRISVPSWVIPGTYGENLRFLAGERDITGVELLFYLYDDEIRAMLDDEWELIAGLAGRFTYTAHLADRIMAEHGELVARLLPLVRNFVVHPYPAEEAEAEKGLLASWTAAYGGRARGTEDLGALSPFLIENTQPGWQEALLPLLPPGTGLVMDTGHLLLEGRSPAEFFRRFGGRVGEIHLHTVDRAAASGDGRLPDHRPLRAGEAWFEEFAPYLASFGGIVNLEVFSWEEVQASLAVLRGAGLLE